MVWSTIYDIDETQPLGPFHCSPPKQFTAAAANSYLDHYCLLDVYSPAPKTRLTGIVCTIGPSTEEVETLESMIESGMNIATVLFSHGTLEDQVQLIRNVRTAAENYSKRLGITFPMTIALDIKGPEIRIGYVEGGISAEVELKKGEQIKLTTDKAYFEKGNASIMFIDYDNIQKVVQVGNRIYIDDGLISLICTTVQGSVLTCTIECGGMLGSCKNVNLPGVEVDLPVVSEKDKQDLLLGLEHGIDMVFVSFIRNAAAINEVREILGPKGDSILVIAKIENQQGMQNIDEIIKAADGLMVGRGDLGIELPLEKLFIAQKSIIAKCNLAGKPVICANQLLFTMMKKRRPSRAECTDVANAVLDGTDCVMLTGETAHGEYPLECIRVMAKICKEAEAAVWYKQTFIELVTKVLPPLEPPHAISIAAVEAAVKCSAAAIIVNTVSGKSAYLIARYRPNCPILTVTRSPETSKQGNLFRGVMPLLYEAERENEWGRDVEARISFAISFGKWRGFIRAGDPVVAVYGSQRGSGNTDTLRILYVMKPIMEGEPCGCDIIL